MSRYFSLPLLLVAVILQTTIVTEFRIADGGVDLPLLLIVSWVLLAGLEEGLIWAIVGGILQDLVRGIPPGVSSLAFVVATGLPGIIIGQVSRRNLIFPPLVAAMATAIYHVLLIGLYAVISRPVDFSYVLVYVTAPTLVFNVALSLPVFRAMGVVYAATRPRGITM